MIIKSKARRMGGLAAHLTDAKKNERVIQRHDLDRDANLDLGTALLDFGTNAKLASPNPRARQLFHIKVSPSHILTESELIRTIELIEAEHNIPQSTPRKVVEHLKGNRAEHYHLVYSHYDPITGKAICTKRNHINDEMASRLCELHFNEAIVVGKHTEKNAAELKARGLTEDAAKLRCAMSEKEHSSGGRSIIRYNDADRLKKSVSFEDRIWELFAVNGRDISRFKTAATKTGFVFAMGDKAIMILDPETGISIPLLRLLNKRAKAKGLGADLRKADLVELAKIEPLPPLKAVREQSMTRRINYMKRRAAIERELFLRFAPKAKVEQPADPEMGKKDKPTMQTIETAIEFNQQLQEALRQKLLAILLKKKIIQRLTKRLERKSPRGMTLFLANETASKRNVNQTAIMGANKIAMMTVARARNLKVPSQSQAVNAVRYAPTKNAPRNKSATLKKPKQVTASIER
ncbi:hypothetical protein [Ochrobactrum sp. MYb379]|uniref:hypothetical protein n=1 Tax=Ochrobactrum sp. MYb379 TaxID=2745275 RepID=UPI0030A4D0AA